MTVRLGGDYSFARPSVSELQALGITFVARYFSDFPAKNLTLAEAQTLSNAGIDIVSNFENTADDATGGYAAGFRNAQLAWQQHKACGGPDGRPVYFSIDSDVNAASTDAYFRGCVAALGVDQVGVYGSTALCVHLKAAGLVRWTWRTMSTGWAGGVGSESDFNVEQTGFFNSSIDRNASITDDFGQWRVGQAAPITGGDIVTPQDIVNFWHYSSGDGTPGYRPDNPDVHQSLLEARDNSEAILAAVAALRAEVAAIRAKVGA